MSSSVLTALKSELKTILSRMSSNGMPTARDIVEEYRKNNPTIDRMMSVELENIALVKLIGGIADLRRVSYDSNQGELFDNYAIPGYINIREGGKNHRKRASEATMADLEEILERFKDVPKKKPKHILEFERLLQNMKNSGAPKELTASQFLNKSNV